MSEANRDLLRVLLRDFVPWLALCVVVVGWVWSGSAAIATVSTQQADHERRLTAVEVSFYQQTQQLSDLKAQIAGLSAQISDLRRALGVPPRLPPSAAP